MRVHPQWPTIDAVERTLMDPHHEGHGRIEQRIQSADHVDEERGELVATCGIERWKIGHLGAGSEQEFVGP